MERIPKISVGLPVYNGEKYLAGALNSLIHQDFEDFELIISNNASTDRTDAICRDFAARDARIRYYSSETNIGASPNYNRVFHLARGEFFKWASHDDECHPSLLRRCLERFAEGPASAVLVFSKAEIIDEVAGTRFPSPDAVASVSSRPSTRFATVLAHIDFVNALWGLIRSDALRRTRLMGCLEADRVLLGELSMLGQLIEIPEVLYYQRRHQASAMAKHRTAKELLSWHDPKKANVRIILPHWESVYVEYMKSAWHMQLPLPERLLCCWTAPAVCYWRRLMNWSSPFRKRFGLSRSYRQEMKAAKATELTRS
jgi:glycosyltransferase involved in cell wall biosynthesis